MDTAKWVVVPLRDGYVVARNGDDGTPEIVEHCYSERHDAVEDAELLNEDDDEE